VNALKAGALVLGNPLLMALLLMGAGLWLLRRKRVRPGTWILAGAVALAYLSSTSLVGNALLVPLERQYPALDLAKIAAVSDIVVLGSGYEPYDHIPVTGALDPDGLARIAEGVRLARARPGARLLVSGGARPGHAPIAEGYAQFAAAMGIAPSSVVSLHRALDTAQEARDVFAVLGHSPFILVTSAYHMPRAMKLMQRAGAQPLAAPTGQLMRTHGSEAFGVLPGSRGLRKTETALHEYLGLAALGLGIGKNP
jgi:uncharacterized SAM-binding protein YcdF (DUF218 family)